MLLLTQDRDIYKVSTLGWSRNHYFFLRKIGQNIKRTFNSLNQASNPTWDDHICKFELRDTAGFYIKPPKENGDRLWNKLSCKCINGTNLPYNTRNQSNWSIPPRVEGNQALIMYKKN